MADALQLHQDAFDARTEQRRTAINAAIDRRRRASPDPAAPDVPVIGTTKGPQPGQPPRIYAFQIAALQRHLQRTSDPARTQDLKRQIARLQRLSGHAPAAVARQGTMRFRNRAEGEAHLKLLDAQIEAMAQHGLEADAIHLELVRADVEKQINEAHPVAAHVVRSYRGGETAKQIRDRLEAARTSLRTRRGQLLTAFNRRSAQLSASARARVVTEMEQLLHQRMIHAGGRGAAIGGAIGLTTVGIALLARHIAAARRGRKLAKAAQKTPEQSMAAGLAETYRQWIDRLLGNNDRPIKFGDDLAAALGPGLTQAFAAGATQPPAPSAGQDPHYWIDVDFDALNPAVRRHMAAYALDRIVEISSQQREAIRQTLMDQSVLQGIGPRDVARTIRQSIGLTAYQTEVVARYRDELETLDPAALERKLRDKRYDRTVNRAIDTDTPLTPEQINAMVDAYHRRMLALRAETIARTEAIRATSYGAVARAQDVLDSHPELDVIKSWIATDDERTRDTHRDLNGKEVQGIETPFETSAGNLLRWPVDQKGAADETINCRCALGFRFIPKQARQAVTAA